MNNLSQSFSQDCSFMDDESDEPWQARTESVSERLRLLYKDKHFTDLTIELKEGKKLQAHKLILATHSPYFKKMFYGSLPCSNVIKMDVPEDVITWVLEYMYLGILKLPDVDLAVQAYRFAHEKQLDRIVARCSKFLSTKITEENALSILEMAVLYSDDSLKLEATKKIFGKRESLFFSDVANMRKTVLLDLLSKDDIPCSDKATFQAALRWSLLKIDERAEESTPEVLRREMNDFLPYIHFLQMPLNFFVDEVMSTGIFTPDESISILRKISGNNCEIPEFVRTDRLTRVE